MIANRQFQSAKKLKDRLESLHVTQNYFPLEFIEQRHVASLNTKRKLHGDNLYPLLTTEHP